MRYFKFCDVPAGAPNPVPNEGNDIDNDNYHTSINQMYLGIFQYGASLKNVCAAWACGNINIYFGYQWQKTVSSAPRLFCSGLQYIYTYFAQNNCFTFFVPRLSCMDTIHFDLRR